MAEEAKEAVEETPESTGKFVDTQLVQKSIPKPIPDERLLELAEQANEKHLRIIELKDDVKAYSASKGGQAKELEKEVRILDEQFSQKTEMVSTEVQKIADFETGKVRYVNPETSELLLEEDMQAGDNQREFAAVMEEAGQDLVEQARVEIADALVTAEGNEEVLNAVGLVAAVVGNLGISEALSGRLVVLLREKGVVRGRGYPGFPFVVCDPEAEEAAEKEQSEELTEEQITEAVEAVIDLQRASTASLQRKMQVGYNLAARLMDALEQRGVISVGSEESLGEILMTVEEYEALNAESGEEPPVAEEKPEGEAGSEPED